MKSITRSPSAFAFVASIATAAFYHGQCSFLQTEAFSARLSHEQRHRSAAAAAGDGEVVRAYRGSTARQTPHDKLFHAVTFVPSSTSSSSSSGSALNAVVSASTTAIPDTERKIYTPKTNPSKQTDSQGKKPFVNDKLMVGKGRGNRMEYLQDDETELRGMQDPHHILLMGFETFQKERITVPYVQGSLMYVLDMPESEAYDHAQFAKEEGISCLGTWTRQECLNLGGKLMQRDLVCRVVPGTPAGAQGWQAKDASSSQDIYDIPSISAE